MPVPFEKWQALGNDYVILESERLPFALTAGRVRRICAPHLGIGSDGVLLLSPHEDPAFEARLRIFNPDGSEAELSGNGARQAILYLVRSGWTDQRTFSIETAAGEIRSTVTSPTTCRIDMGHASLTSASFPSGPEDGRGELEAAGRRWSFRHVEIGNPQCVIEIGDQLEELDLSEIGPLIERHEIFPNRTNVSFVRTRGSRLRARIFERGVGETLSSGTGAAGAAVAAVLNGAASPVIVELDGGELEVGVTGDLQVEMTGWAVPVYHGELAPELVENLEEA